MTPKRIVIIENDEELIRILRLHLEKEGFSVYSTTCAKYGIQLIKTVKPDILLLDIHYPDQNGLELAKKYREISNGILIFITGEQTKSTIIKGFEIGCDDYVRKPFDPSELIARIKAHLRRVTPNPPYLDAFGNLTINFQNKTVHKHGKEVELYTKEKMLLLYLARHPNQIFSAEHLFEQIWGIDSDADLKTVHVHISTLRKKIEDYPKKPSYIITVRGFGYKFTY